MRIPIRDGLFTTPEDLGSARLLGSRCSGCRLCLNECPYQALEMTEAGGRTTARVNEVLCKGCGSCAAACPSGAITQHGFTADQLEAEVAGALGR